MNPEVKSGPANTAGAGAAGSGAVSGFAGWGARPKGVLIPNPKGRLADKTLAFDEKCAGYMTAHPELVPSFVSVPELAKDRTLRTDLNDIARELGQVFEGVEDTIMLASSEAYMADLSFYQNVRQAAQRGVVGADSIYSDLNERFPGRPPKAAAAPAVAK